MCDLMSSATPKQVTLEMFFSTGRAKGGLLAAEGHLSRGSLTHTFSIFFFSFFRGRFLSPHLLQTGDLLSHRSNKSTRPLVYLYIIILPFKSPDIYEMKVSG